MRRIFEIGLLGWEEFRMVSGNYNVIVWKLENAVTLWFFLLQPEISIP